MREEAGTRRTSPERAAASPRPDGRSLRRAETRERLRVAAFELFASVGFEETTTSAIAARAGVASGTVFVHASDKSDLLFLVMHDRIEATVERQFATLEDGPLLDQLMHLFGGLLRMYGEYPTIASAFVRHLPGARGPNAQRLSTLTFAFLHRLARLVTDAQARGEVSTEVSPFACSHNLFGLYFVALVTWLDGHATLDGTLEPLLRASLGLQIRGFRP